jgi:hypothetical protein
MSLGPYSSKYRTTDKLKINAKGENSYIDVGDPFVKPIAKPARVVGKQFVTEPPKNGQTGRYFDKYTYSSTPYTEIRKYSVEQKRSERKSGFGSNDASKRDEFLITMREGQWKELVDQEHHFTNKWVGEREAAAQQEVESGVGLPPVPRPVSAPELPHLPHFQQQTPVHLYDIGNTVEGSTPACIKCHRERFYCKHRVFARNGEVVAQRPRQERLTSMDIGRYVDPADAARPVHAYHHKAKEFFDASHLNEHRLGSW